MADKHRVLILGGGFGGLYAAQALKHAPFEITLVDQRNFHLFQPLLYQVATGSLSPGEIAAPLRGILSKQKNTRVLLGEATDIDPSAKRVQLKDGAQIPYDSLIVATGSQSNYFGHNEWSQWAPSLKSVEEATAIRHKILLAFEAAERTVDQQERQAWLTFVIVGAGATGVELAGAVGEIALYTLKNDFRSINSKDSRIIVVDGGERVLSTYPLDLSKKAENALVRLGARVRTGLMVTCIDRNGVTLKKKSGEEEHIASHTVIWAAGVGTSDFARRLATRTSAPTERGRIKVNPDLTIPNYPDIFAIGDIAYLLDRRREAFARRCAGRDARRRVRGEDHPPPRSVARRIQSRSAISIKEISPSSAGESAWPMCSVFISPACSPGSSGFSYICCT